jgi:hypothetical protein
MYPGMMVRLEQQTLDSMKTVLQKFLPKYVNEGLKMPDHYHFEFGLLHDLLTWKIDWTDITYTPVDLDIEDVKFELTRGYDISLIKFDFPAIKHWEVDAMQVVNTWFLPSTSKVELIIKDLDIDF